MHHASVYALFALINFHFLIQFSETDEHNVAIKLEIIMVSSTSPATVRAKAGAIFRVTSGNFLEQFDFFLFGFYATYIAHTFSRQAVNLRH